VSTVFLVNPASANGSTGRKWPVLARRAAELGLKGDALLSEHPGHLTALAAQAVLIAAITALASRRTLFATLDDID
jgi:diacylglycerol kinase family enzyme